jgi:hypothetical protein
MRLPPWRHGAISLGEKQGIGEGPVDEQDFRERELWVESGLTLWQVLVAALIEPACLIFFQRGDGPDRGWHARAQWLLVVRRRRLFAGFDEPVRLLGHGAVQLLDLRDQGVNLVLLASDHRVELVDEVFLVNDLVLEHLETFVDFL